METGDLCAGEVLIRKAHRGRLQELIEIVVNAKVDVNYRNHNESTALHAAAAAGQLEVVQWLASHPDIDLTVVDDEDQSALHYAAFHGHVEVVQYLVEQGVPLDIPDKFGRLAHIIGSLNGHLDVVQYLIEECGDVININAIDEYGGTALHWAASRGRAEIIAYLCRAGIDLYVTSFDNKTALQVAKDRHKVRCLQILKSWMENAQKFIGYAKEGTNVELEKMIGEINNAYPLQYLRDRDGRNAFYWAASCGHLSTLKLLARHFTTLTDVDKYGRTALHAAALEGHKECSLWLVKTGRGTPLAEALTLTGKPASRCAFEAGHSELAAKLQSLEEGHDELYHNEIRDTPSLGVRGNDMNGNETSQKSSGYSLGTNSNSKDINAVQEWLESIDMAEYTQQFHSDGFDTLRNVATIDESDLIDMNVKKGHRRVVLLSIQQLQQQLEILDEEARCLGVEPEAKVTLDMLTPVPTLTLQLSSSNSFGEPKPLVSKPSINPVKISSNVELANVEGANESGT